MKKTKNVKTLNKKKITKLIVIILLISLVTAIGVVYENNIEFRNFLDKYIFFKEKHENNLPKILINSTSDINTYAYNGNVLILKSNLLTVYNSNGNELYTLDIQISNPIFKASGRYLCIAEKNGNKVYVISDKNIVWQKDIEGNISDITINSNGYMAVATTGSIHKTVVQVFNNKGEAQFNTYLSSTYVIDMDISPDNKNLAIAEANFSGIIIQSNIKIISMDKAKNGDKDAIYYTQTNTEGDLIINIKYQTKDELTCVYDEHIEIIKNGDITNISDFKNEDVLFVELNNNIVKIIKENSKVYLQVLTNSSENTKQYDIFEPKEICASDSVVAINLGSEVLFYSTSGWLIKRYYASQEINKIVLCDGLAGIVYSDKIELVSL